MRTHQPPKVQTKLLRMRRTIPIRLVALFGFFIVVLLLCRTSRPGTCYRERPSSSG